MTQRLEWHTHELVGNEQIIHIHPTLSKDAADLVILSRDDSIDLCKRLNEAAHKDPEVPFSEAKQAILRDFYRRAR